MSSKTLIKYRTFSELLDDVSLDFNTFLGESMIEPSQLIKIATKCSYELGLKIYKTKDAILDINHGKAKLPDDFYVLNSALVCDKWKLEQPVINTGRHTEDVFIGNGICDICKKYVPSEPCSTPDECCICNKVYTNECRDSFKVVEKIRYEIRYYDEFEHLTFRPNKRIDKDSFNLRNHGRYHGEIKDGYIYTDINCGRLYISYEGNLEDDEGNLLVMDHPLVNEFYEAALKERLLQNLYINGEDVLQRWQMIKQDLRVARINALSFINMPDYEEIQEVHQSNRRKMFHQYYRIFL